MLKATEIKSTLRKGGNATKIPAGIRKDVKIVALEKGANYVDIHFEDQEGRVQNNRIWDHNPDKIYPRDGESDQEAAKRDKMERLDHLNEVLEIFLTKEEFNSFEAPTYDAYVNKAISSLPDEVLSSKTVNIKLLPDSTGLYSEFSRFAGGNIEECKKGQPSSLKYSKWELENRINVDRSSPVETTDSSIVSKFNLFNQG